MAYSQKKLRIGILGCGSIGSRIAKSTKDELKNACQLSGIYDIDQAKLEAVATFFKQKRLAVKSYAALLQRSDLVVEAIHAANTQALIAQALKNKKHVMAMSVGKLLGAKNLFELARRNHCTLLVPSGAVAGIDAIKAARLGHISELTLTTRKPISGFSGHPYLKEKGIDLSQIKSETVLFDGDVATAVKLFPQNINVAATLALASQSPSKIRIRIITAPDYKLNSHEVELLGDCGRIFTRTENTVCPDNPKTSYLAVLSAIQTLKDFCLGTRIGT